MNQQGVIGPAFEPANARRVGRFASIDDTADELGISRVGVYRLLDRGDLRSIKLGARRLVSRESIEELIEKAAA